MINMKTIEQFEDQALWQSALEVAADSFQQRPEKDTAIRLLFVCWYVLVEWPCIESEEELHNESFEHWLIKVTSYLITNFSNDAKVNFYLGYMISISPWFFSKDVESWEQRANDMLEVATQLESTNPIYQMVYLASIEDEGSDYEHYCELARPLVNDMYSGLGEFNQYFRDVLSR